MPEEIDREIARLKLESMGVDIDALTAEQNEVPRRRGTRAPERERESHTDVQTRS